MTKSEYKEYLEKRKSQIVNMIDDVESSYLKFNDTLSLCSQLDYIMKELYMLSK